MAIRSNVTSKFATTAPPWSLATLDGYFNSVNGTLNDSSLGLVNTGADTGTANNYNVPVLDYGMFSAYNPGSTFVLIPANTNTGPSTIQISGLLSTPILDIFGNALLGGVLQAGCVYPLIYIGSAFRLVRNTSTVTYQASNTPIFGSWGTIGGWFVLAGTAPIVTYN